MNCTEFRAAVAAAIERRTAPGIDVATHLDDCCDAECRTCWQDARLLDRAIREWRQSQSSVDVTDFVVAECWNSATPVRPSATRRSTGGSLPRTATLPRAAAAVVAAAVVLLSALLLVPPTGDPDATSIVVQAAPAGSIRNTAAAPDSPRDPAGAAGLAYVAYAQNAAQFVTDAVVLTLGDREAMEDPTIKPIGIGWEATWPPLGDEMNAAFEDLLESLPSETPAS